MSRVWGSFDRRITTRLTLWPARLLWLAWGDPTTRMVERLRVCEDLLRTPPSMLHITARKVRAIFGPELRYAVANGGVVPSLLYSLMKTIALLWRADTQEIEGIHNLIKLAAKSSTVSKQRTLDAVVGLRKWFGLGSTATKRLKWSQVEPQISAAITVATQYSQEAAAITCERGYFAIPKPAQLALQDCYEQPGSAGRGAVEPHMAWALAQTLEFHRRTKGHALVADSKIAIVFKVHGSIDQVWICCMAYEKNGTWIRCHVNADSDAAYKVGSPPVSSQASVPKTTIQLRKCIGNRHTLGTEVQCQAPLFFIRATSSDMHSLMLNRGVRRRCRR